MRESGREWRHQLEVCDAKAARRLARERRRDSLERLLVVPAAGVDVGLDRKHHSGRRTTPAVLSIAPQGCYRTRDGNALRGRHRDTFVAVFEACSHAHTCHLALATRAAVPPTAAYSTLARLPSMPRGPCAKATRALTTQATPRAQGHSPPSQRSGAAVVVGGDEGHLGDSDGLLLATDLTRGGRWRMGARG